LKKNKPEIIFSILYSLFLLSSAGCLPAGRHTQLPLPPEASVPSQKFSRPLKSLTILSRFGPREGRFHTGIDLRGHRGGGDPVLASREGKITFASRLSGYGNLIAIQHPDGYTSRYAHLKKILVKKGQRVAALQEIGLVGQTGHATTAHLHFEILTPHSRFLDPYPFLFQSQQIRHSQQRQLTSRQTKTDAGS
jgi:murein DD-endopeptidase MepM/ murein hydrolase activator NlpD